MLHWFRQRAPASPGEETASPSDALKAQGNALFAQGRLDEAAASFRRAIALDAGNAAAHFNLGLVLREQGELDAAAQALERSRDDDAMHLIGAIRLQQGRLPDALLWLDRALAAQPGHADSHANRGMALAAMGHASEAANAFTRALALQPGDSDIYNRLGALQASDGRTAPALENFERALQIEPSHADALSNRATALGVLGRREESVRAFEQLLAVAPDFKYAPGLLLSAKLRICEWQGRDALMAGIASRIAQGLPAVNPFDWLASCGSAASQLACSRIYAGDKYPPAEPLWRGERYAHERIRIAYLSADLHDHATAQLMAGFFEHHDKARFETIAISFGPQRNDAMRERLARAFDPFIDAHDMTDLDIARLVRELEVDIAVDLKGYTTDARCGIFAHRPAPLQVAYMGYPGTLGVDYMDYLMADAQIAGPGDDRWYSEKVVRLPGSYQANDTKRRIAPGTPTRAGHGLPPESFVFCCFNNNYKITPDIFDVWMRLLAQVPGSVFWLLQDNDAAARNLRLEAQRRGIDPQRLVFAPRMPVQEHLARHVLADLFLDTLPCNAHTTASDALWAGLPVLTLKGEAFAARVAASLLCALGLDDLVTHSAEAYEARARALATDAPALADVRARLSLARGNAALFDTALTCRRVEAAYTAMWKAQQAGLKPAPFDCA